MDTARPAYLKGKKKKGEEWLVTFADLMALLFAFFVLLTFISTAPKNCTGLTRFFEENRDIYQNFELRNSKEECVITLPSDFLFRSGGDTLQRRAFQRLTPLFQKVRDLKEHENDLIIVDELGYIPLDRHGAEHLFGFFSQCYEQVSLIITTNLPFTDWPQIFADDERMTGAMLDRLTHHVNIVAIEGDSFRLKASTSARAAKKGGSPPEKR